MTDITIYTEAYRASCIDYRSDADIEIYDDHISRYFGWLTSGAVKAGLDLALEDGGSCRSCHAATDEAWQFMYSSDGFWDWYNRGTVT